MKIVVPTLSVLPDDGFQNDAFERSRFGEALRNLVVQSQDALVVMLNGRWGEGKTTFIQMWRGLLAEENVHSIYIDAFANDHVDDPFIPLASEISKFVDENLPEESRETAEDIKDKAKRIGAHLLSWSAKVGVKAATLGILKDSDIEELQEMGADISEGVSTVVSNFIEEQFASHAASVELIEQFKERLQELPTKLGEEPCRPLVVVVDELDRCKPSFAVNLIERAKHLFSVPGIVFVLVMHKKQLEASINHVYGAGVDSHEYLQKFINIETTLPKNRVNRHDNDYLRYSRRLLALHEVETWGDRDNIVECVVAFASHLDLSLRQLERIFTTIAIFYGSSGERQLRLVPIIVFLAVLKATHPDKFTMLLAGKLTYADISNVLGLRGIARDDPQNRRVHWLMQWIEYAMLTEEEFNALDAENELRQFGRSLFQYNVDRERLIPIFAQQVAQFVVY